MNFLKKNWYWLLPLLIAVGGGAYLYWLNNKDEVLPASDNLAGDLLPKTLNKSVKLYNGIQGYKNEVIYLQSWLNKRGGNLTVDGIFGENTAKELYKQKRVWDIKLSDL